jgi:hypothetical protein
VNLFKPSPKQWILIVVVVYVGVTVFINLSRKKTEEPIQNTSSIKKIEVPDAKPANVVDQDKLKQLKVLESKLSASKKKYAEVLRLRGVIEAQLKLRIDSLKSSEGRIHHLMKLFSEGALNEQDLELARAQHRGIEVEIEKNRSDSVKINKSLEDYSKKVAQAESDLSQFKNQMNVDSKN